MADVTNDDIATVEEIQATFGGVVEIDTGWRARSYDDSWKVAWIVRHPPKDCEHGLVLASGGTLDNFSEQPAPVDVGDWGIAGRTVINNQIVRFGVGENAFSLHVETMSDSARDRLLEVARVVAARLPPSDPPGGLAEFCTRRDAAEVFGASAGFPQVWEASSVTWHHFAVVEPVQSESLLFQRPANSPFEDPPTLEHPALFSRLYRTHDPDGAPGTVDASAELFWTQAGTLYRLAHNRHAYKPAGGTIDYLPVEPLLVLARRIASRLDDAAR